MYKGLDIYFSNMIFTWLSFYTYHKVTNCVPARLGECVLSGGGGQSQEDRSDGVHCLRCQQDPVPARPQGLVQRPAPQSHEVLLSHHCVPGVRGEGEGELDVEQSPLRVHLIAQLAAPHLRQADHGLCPVLIHLQAELHLVAVRSDLRPPLLLPPVLVKRVADCE